MRWIVNRLEVEREVDVRTSLLDLLREHLHLFGVKKGCNQGSAIDLDGWFRVSLAWMIFAVAVQTKGLGFLLVAAM